MRAPGSQNSGGGTRSGCKLKLCFTYVHEGQAQSPRMRATGEGSCIAPTPVNDSSQQSFGTLIANGFRRLFRRGSAGVLADLQQFQRRRQNVLHILGYGGLLLLEALSVGTSMTAHSGGVATAALVVGLLGSVPTANHFAGHLFERATRGSDWSQGA